MLREEIISKGFYARPQASGCVSVKQFILMRKNGKKRLLLRFENHRKDVLNALSFSVRQYDARGALIAQDRFDLKRLAHPAESTFILDREIRIKERCADFQVIVHSAAYGNYLYQVHGQDVQVVYQKESEAPTFDAKAASAKLGGDTQRVSPRTMSGPKPVLWFACAVLLLLAVLIGVQLYNFTRTEVFFTLENLEYAFETDDHVNGPICITGYRGNAGNVVIPNEIEGHHVARIGVGAFSSSGLKSVTVEGTARIEARAFADNRFLQSVTLRQTTLIGDSAFENCYSMHSFEAGAMLQRVGQNAFFGCAALESVTLPETLFELGAYAFKDCLSLQTAILPRSLQSIGERAFEGCTSLNTLSVPFIGVSAEEKGTLGYLFTKIPESLSHVTVTNATTVGNHAFAEATGLKTVTFTQKITSVGTAAFKNCRSLTAFEIPQDLQSIGVEAFYNCASLQSIRLPSDLKEIRAKTFYGCSSLLSLELPQKLQSIGEQAFYGCSSLSEMVLPSSVKTVEGGVFGKCNSLVRLTLPYLGTNENTLSVLSFLFEEGRTNDTLQSLTVLSGRTLLSNAFEGFTGLKTVSLPNELQALPQGAFFGCTSLEEVHIPNTVKTVAASAFEGCSSLEHLRLPANITEIRERTFYGCSSLREIDVPDAVERIHSYAFAECVSLTQVDLPATLSVLSDYVFYGCTSLKNVVLPSRIQNLPQSVFENCFALQDVTFPSTLLTVGSYAFANCRTLTSVDLPQGVTALGKGAFSGCTALKSFTVPTSVTSIGAELLLDCSAIESLTVPFMGEAQGSKKAYPGFFFSSRSGYTSNNQIPASLERVEITLDPELLSYAFRSAVTIKEIVLPTGVTEIPVGAFYGCSELSTLALPQTVRKIGERAFVDCVSLCELTLPDGLTEIGTLAFSRCLLLSEIEIPQSVTVLESNIFAECVSLQALSMPKLYDRLLADHFNGVLPQTLKKVVLSNAGVIPIRAFEGASYLEEVVLENAVLIDEWAFNGCTALQKVSLGEKVERINGFAFFNCTSLAEITLPDALTEIGAYAFANCTLLQKITVPNSVQSFGEYAFNGCRGMQEMTLPFVGSSRISDQGLGYLIENHAVESLKKVTLTDCEHLPSFAFEYFSNLQEIVLPQSLKTVGQEAFNGCSSLRRLTIPQNVISIGWRAFGNCEMLYLINNESALDLRDMGYVDIGIYDNVLKICNQDETPMLVEKDGFEFLMGDDGFWYLIGYSGELTDLTLPARVPYGDKDDAIESYRIAHHCFYQNRTLKGVYIPATVTEIGNHAFQYSTLAAVSFAPVSSLQTIGYNAFADTQITDAVLPEGLTFVHACAFAWCNELASVTLPLTLKEIEYDAFYDCTKLFEVYDLSTLNVQKGSYEHGGVALYALLVHTTRDAERLHEVTVNGLIYKTSGDFWILTGCDDTVETLTIDTFTYNDKPVKEFAIAPSAFSDRLGIKELTIGGAVTSIGNRAFAFCSGLVKVTFTEESTLQALPEYAFSDCHSLEEVQLPSTLQTIGNYAFAWCYMLQSIDLPDSLTGIESNAFLDCHELQSITLPASLQSIEDRAFQGCYSLIEVCNLSSLPIAAGSREYGKVAEYAIAVYTSPSEAAPRQSVETNDATFEFIQANGTWHLYSVVTNSYGILYFPTLEASGLSSYQISDYALRNADFSDVMIPTEVSAIGSVAKNRLLEWGNDLYYEGTQLEFLNLMSGVNLDYVNVFYYSACVHEGENTWTYDANAKVSTEATQTVYTVVKEANCTEFGEAETKCSVCNKSQKVMIDPNGEHDFDENGTCNRCQAVAVLVTAENFATLEYLSNLNSHPFVFRDTGEITVPDLVPGGYSNLVVSATREMTVSFYVFSQGTVNTSYRTIIRVNGKMQTYETGGSTFSYTMQPGDELTVQIRCVLNVENIGLPYIRDMQLIFPAETGSVEPDFTE